MPDMTAILILAAGGSSRMGRPKQLIDYRGQPLLRHAARTALEAALGPVIVVLGSSGDVCQAAVAGLDVRCLRNANWKLGLSTSIRLGIEHVSTLPVGRVVIMLCDQPEITAGHLRLLVEGCADPMLAAATAYEGTLGVPAAFHRSLFPQLLTLTGDQGAKEVLRRRQKLCAAIPLAAAALDIDTPADAAALKGAAPSEPSHALHSPKEEPWL